MRYILKPAMLLVFSLVIFSWGCAREEGLLKNPGFKVSDNTIKDWAIEGEGSFERAADGGIKLVALTGSPFLYQQAPAKKRHKGSSLSLGAWVRTDQPDSVFIEFSNRLGIDARSETHPGDGKWHLMTVTSRVPEASQMLEFRLRISKPGAAFIKDASMSPGMTALIDGAGPGLDAPVFLTFLADGTLLALMFGLVARFREFSDTATNRIFEAFVMLAILSAMVLVLGRTSNATVVSNIAWAAGCAGGIVFIIRGLEKPLAARLPSVGVLISGATAMLLIIVIISLRDGALATAGRSALAAYILFISSLAAIPVYRMYRKVVEGQARQTKVRIYRTPDPDGGD
ncbi:MAG: hypothetical protein AABY51_04420 [Deltaproteobacteria bacterium]